MKIKLKKKTWFTFYFIRLQRCMSHAHSAWCHIPTANSKVKDNKNYIHCVCIIPTTEIVGLLHSFCLIGLAWLGFLLLALRFQYDMRAIVHSECNLTIATKKYLTFVAVRNAMQVKWNEISLNAIHCVSKSKPLFLFGIIANQNDDDDGHEDNDSKN